MPDGLVMGLCCFGLARKPPHYSRDVPAHPSHPAGKAHYITHSLWSLGLSIAGCLLAVPSHHSFSPLPYPSRFGDVSYVPSHLVCRSFSALCFVRSAVSDPSTTRAGIFCRALPGTVVPSDVQFILLRSSKTTHYYLAHLPSQDRSLRCSPSEDLRHARTPARRPSERVATRQPLSSLPRPRWPHCAATGGRRCDGHSRCTGSAH